MTDQDNLLLRWARLKQAAKAAAEHEAPADLEPLATAAPIEPVSLPSLESIGADTDVIAFLRAGVPAELTKLALRRAWTSDPAIRDFIGIAENQWDFNNPNGIPGFGQLEPGESGVDVLAQISTRLERLPGTLGDLTVPAAPISASTDQRSFDQDGISQMSVAVEPGVLACESQAVQESPDMAATVSTRKRRPHGSALPVSGSTEHD